MFEIDNPAKIPYTEKDVTTHKVKWNNTTIDIIQTSDGRFDIVSILECVGKRYDHFKRDKHQLWAEFSTVLNAPAVINCKYHNSNTKGRHVLLHCIPEKLLSSALLYCNDETLSVAVFQYIKKTMGRPIDQFDEIKCQIVTEYDESTKMQYMLARSEANNNYYNMEPIIESIKKSGHINGANKTIKKFLANVGIKNYINECESGGDDTQVHYVKFGVTWMRSDLMVKFASWVDVKFDVWVTKLNARILTGDFSVIPDIIQSIDQINGTRTLAQFWTYEKKTIQENEFVKQDYERRLLDLEKKVEEYRTMQAQTQLQLTDTKTTLNTFQMVVSVPEKTTKRALEIARGPRAQSFQTAFNYVRESEGALYKQIDELTLEVRELKDKLSLQESQYILMQEKDSITNKLIDDLDNEIEDHMKIYLSAKEFAGRVITYAMEHGLTIPLSKRDKKVIDRETLHKIESKSIRVKKSLSAIQARTDTDFQEYQRKKSNDTSDEPPTVPFVFAPRYINPMKCTDMDPIYIYCIKHDHRSSYFKWVMHDQGPKYKDASGYSTILSDSPFEDNNADHMVFVGTIHRKPYESDKPDPFCELGTLDLLQKFALSSECHDDYFPRASKQGYVVFTTHGHPKTVEKELCYLIRPIISHKTYGSNTTKSFDNWITELTPIHTRMY
jgi:hypothetical protein